ncbi:MAG: class I SAM-dependent methyltransferase [Burkholderiales bacterium]|nr:class I SAM-dependent methyltransferase [Burkholderiales bacterium]
MTQINACSAHCIVCNAPMESHIPSIYDDRYGCPGVFSIARCRVCGQMATVPRLEESDLPALYSRYYPRREVDYIALEREAKKAVAPLGRLRRWLAGTDNQGHYRARPGQTVLDIGSGSCLSLLELREMNVTSWGVEADPNVKDIALHFGLNVHIGSIHDNPFPGKSFDLIVMNQVIEHVPDPLSLLEVVRKRLNPYGRVVLSFPNTASAQAHRSGVRWINWHVPYHQHHFNRASFSRLAARAGYEVVNARSITPNLWTLLQLRANRETPVQGQVSSTWSSQVSAPGRRSIWSRWFLRAARFLALGIAMGSMAVTNRIRDLAGKGDSLLVELRAASMGRR